MTSHREVESTYAPGPDDQLPDLTALPGVATLRTEPVIEHAAVYLDTPDLALVRAGVSLRRRVGGPDQGWHLKLPAGGRARDEVQLPLGDETPPAQLVELVAGWTRGAPLGQVATIETRRTPVVLLDQEGLVLAELVDDHVTGTTTDARLVQWREWELELVEGSSVLLDEADALFAAAGVGRAEVDRKIARVLAHRLPDAPRRRRPRAGKPVARLLQQRLSEQVDAIARRDVGARQGRDGDVHQMRVACRRLRSALTTYAVLLDPEQTAWLRAEVRWLAHVLGEARDAAVVHERLLELVEQEPAELVLGPVHERLASTFEGRGKAELRVALESERYHELRARLDALSADPPLTDRADGSVADVAPRLLRRELKRFTRREESAAETDAPEALHEARKAAKRLRYAAESLEPVAGSAARRLARAARRVTSELGDLQDIDVTRGELVALARAADEAGEPSFTYGRLHARLEVDEARAVTAYWAADPARSLAKAARRTTRAVTRGR